MPEEYEIILKRIDNDTRDVYCTCGSKEFVIKLENVGVAVVEWLINIECKKCHSVSFGTLDQIVEEFSE